MYFVNKSSAAAKQNYLPLEKVTCALLIASRKLRHYFDANPIKVYTSHPIKAVLRKADISEFTKPEIQPVAPCLHPTGGNNKHKSIESTHAPTEGHQQKKIIDKEDKATKVKRPTSTNCRDQTQGAPSSASRP